MFKDSLETYASSLGLSTALTQGNPHIDLPSLITECTTQTITTGSGVAPSRPNAGDHVKFVDMDYYERRCAKLSDPSSKAMELIKFDLKKQAALSRLIESGVAQCPTAYAIISVIPTGNATAAWIA